MKELEKNYLNFIGCSEEKIEQMEREKDYFLLEGPEPYYFMQGYEIAEKKYIEQIEKMKCCGNCSKPCWDFPIVRKSECLNNNYSLWKLAE